MYYTIEQTAKEIAHVRGISFPQGELKYLDAQICTDLPNEKYASYWKSFKVASGSEKKAISDLGFCVCKKSEATALLFIGTTNEAGHYTSKPNHFWLKAKLDTSINDNLTINEKP